MSLLRGLIIVLIITIISIYISNLSFVQSASLSSLTVAILIGILYGSTLNKYTVAGSHKGIDFAQKKLLRLGIVLYGFRITFQEIYNLGIGAFIFDLFVVTSIIVSGLFIGRKILKLSYKLSLLIGAGSGVCGAAAILATEGSVDAKPYEVSTAIATVVLYGTIAMFLFPYILQLMDFSDQQVGVLLGGTIHEVAQVVAAGSMISPEVTSSAVIAKLTRVMLLIPFLLLVTYYIIKKTNLKNVQKEVPSSIWSVFPWFAIFFLVASGINSLNILSSTMSSYINFIDSFLLTMAMAALGIDTNLKKIQGAGIKPFILAGVLMLMLTSYLFLPVIIHHI